MHRPGLDRHAGPRTPPPRAGSDQLGTFDQAVAAPQSLQSWKTGVGGPRCSPRNAPSWSASWRRWAWTRPARSGAGEGGLLARLIGQAADEARTVELMNDPTGRYCGSALNARLWRCPVKPGQATTKKPRTETSGVFHVQR